MSPECEAFFAGLYLISPKDVDLMMDHCFDKIDDWCCAGQWGLIDEVLSHVDPDRIPEAVSLGFLTMTWSNMAPVPLLSRPALHGRVKENFLKTMDPLRVERLLKPRE